MSETLLFFHVLAAFILMSAAVVSSAVMLGAQTSARTLWVADRLEDVGATGTLALGIWLALDIDGYSLGDGWILGAIGLWTLAAICTFAWRPVVERDGVSARAKALHWTRTLLVIGILALMVWKPGA